MSLEILLKAAEYIERQDRRDRDTDHVYAAPLPAVLPANFYRETTSSSHKSQINRYSHNELEKSRRANLRYCLDRLRDHVPLGTRTGRHSTLNLLNKAKSFIKNLEEKVSKNEQLKRRLELERLHLQRRLAALGASQAAAYRHDNACFAGQQYRMRLSVSESSASTTSNNSSASNSMSEHDEIDVIGSTSDDDDMDSVESSASESNVMAHIVKHFSAAEVLAQ